MAAVNLTNTPTGIPEAGFFLSIFRFSRIPARENDENQNFNFGCLPRDGKPIIKAEYLPLFVANDNGTKYTHMKKRPLERNIMFHSDPS